MFEICARRNCCFTRTYSVFVFAAAFAAGILSLACGCTNLQTNGFDLLNNSALTADSRKPATQPKADSDPTRFNHLRDIGANELDLGPRGNPIRQTNSPGQSRTQLTPTPFKFTSDISPVENEDQTLAVFTAETLNPALPGLGNSNSNQIRVEPSRSDFDWPSANEAENSIPPTGGETPLSKEIVPSPLVEPAIVVPPVGIAPVVGDPLVRVVQPAGPVSNPSVETTTFCEPLLSYERIGIELAKQVACYLAEKNKPAISNPSANTSLTPPSVDSTSKIQSMLGTSLAAVRKELTSAQLDESQLKNCELQLEALELLVNKKGATPTDTNFETLWRHQLEALVATLQPTALDMSQPESRKSAVESLEHLRRAVSKLEQVANLQVKRGVLCNEVRGFGQYESIGDQALASGQQILVYCEIQNFESTVSNVGGDEVYSTKLRSNLVVCDHAGQVVQQAEFPVVEDIARNCRNDFYLYVPLTIGKLAPGNYRLHLLVEDLGGNKQAALDPAIDFAVK